MGKEDSGTHASRSDDDGTELLFEMVEVEVDGLDLSEVGGILCWTRAMKPGMLSFAEGDGWT